MLSLCKNLERYPVVSTGRKLRYELYGEEGSNINFVEQKDQWFCIAPMKRVLKMRLLPVVLGLQLLQLRCTNRKDQ